MTFNQSITEMKKMGKVPSVRRDLRTFLEELSLMNRAEDTSAHSLECAQKGQQLNVTCPRDTAEMGTGKLKVCVWRSYSNRKTPQGSSLKKWNKLPEENQGGECGRIWVVLAPSLLCY